MKDVVQDELPRRLSLTAISLYAETLEQLLSHEAAGFRSRLPGSFRKRRVGGGEYWYYQYRDLNQQVRQLYCGPVGGAWDRVVERESEALATTDAEERAALLRAAGFPSVPGGPFRLLAALADAGLFRAGGVMVGTYAFMALGNQLGVVWTGRAALTQDVDIARSVGLAVPGVQLDLPEVLEGLQMGYHPVPKLDPRQPSTSFKFRNQELRLDLLTPLRGRRRDPVQIKALGSAAQPLKFLDYLIEHPQPAVLIGRRALRVSVPDPSRFAVHKLLIAAERPAAEAAKARKDLQQAVELLNVLCGERPGDVTRAWDTAACRGRNWKKRLQQSLKRVDAVLRERLKDCGV